MTPHTGTLPGTPDSGPRSVGLPRQGGHGYAPEILDPLRTYPGAPVRRPRWPMDGDIAFAGACFAAATWVWLAASVTMDMVAARVSDEYVWLFASLAATLMFGLVPFLRLRSRHRRIRRVLAGACIECGQALDGAVRCPVCCKRNGVEAPGVRGPGVEGPGVDGPVDDRPGVDGPAVEETAVEKTGVEETGADPVESIDVADNTHAVAGDAARSYEADRSSAATAFTPPPLPARAHGGPAADPVHAAATAKRRRQSRGFIPPPARESTREEQSRRKAAYEATRHEEALGCLVGLAVVTFIPALPGALMFLSGVLTLWSVPLVAPFVIVLTIRVLLSRRTGHRVRLASEGCCVRCGYDLRGSRHECPECGLPLPP